MLILTKGVLKMIDGTEKILDNILDNMDDGTKNTLIKALMTHDKEDVWIQAVLVYEDMCHEGHIIMRYIKEIKYGVSIRHDVDKLTSNEPHMVWLNKEDKIEDIIDSEIKRIGNEYIKMGTTYNISKSYSYGDLLKADGALRELEELKKKIKED